MLIAAQPRHTTGVTIYRSNKTQTAVYFLKSLSLKANLDGFERAILNTRGADLECYFTNNKFFAIDGMAGRTYSLSYKRGGRELVVSAGRAPLIRGHYNIVMLSPGLIIVQGAVAVSIEEGASP